MPAITYNTTEASDEQLFSLLHPLVRQWFSSKFTSFCPPQRLALLNIHSRLNTLVSAPTGSGKTLTAFLSILNELVDSAVKGILQEKIYAVYVSPLKALNNDIAKNLLEPLKDINVLAGRDLGIRVGVRTGDTPTSERQRMLKKPPHLLITTPESLSIALSSRKFSEHLRSVDWCIVDEIHSLAENKRGVHLSLSLERLQSVSPALCRVGLSATVAPLDAIGQFLVGTERDITIVDVQFVKNYDLTVLSPTTNLIDTPHHVIHTGLYQLLHTLIQQHKSTLIFTNTRSGTERVVDNLKERYPQDYANDIGAHHGSLGRELRLDIEERLRAGTLKVCVSSTSLELGIDIGCIDLVLCLGSPKSVARFLQRCGRAGHRLHETVKGRLVVMDRDDLVECAVLLKNAVEKQIDKIHIPQNCLDVLAQTLVGIALERPWNEHELYTVIKRSYCYRGLSWNAFSELLDYLAGKFVDLQQRYIFAKIWRENCMVGKRGKMSRVIYMTNVGTIPEETFITVKIGEQVIGKLDEGFLEKLKTGDVFVLGGQTYEFRFSRGMVAQVRATVNRPPTVPSWVSESLPLSFDLACSIGKFRRLLSEYFQQQKSRKETLVFIQSYLYVDENTAQTVYAYFKEQYQYIGFIPSDKLILIEEVTDPEQHKFVFHTLFGRRVNDCLSRALAYIIARRYQKDVEIGITDNGFFIAGVPKVYMPDIVPLLRADKLPLIMSAAVEHLEVYKRRFRHCAERALMILRNYGGRRKTVGRQQVSSQILMHALRRISQQFSILEEAKREVLEDVMDISNAQQVLERIDKGIIQLKYVKTSIPSPFAFTIALQGHLDVLKMEDRYAFLRRMHEYVLAKISKKELVEITSGALYPELWEKQAEQQQQEQNDRQRKLLADAEMAVRKLALPHDFLTNLAMVIHGEKAGYRADFLVWLDRLMSGPVPKAVSDNLAKLLIEKKEELRP